MQIWAWRSSQLNYTLNFEEKSVDVLIWCIFDHGEIFKFRKKLVMSSYNSLFECPQT